MSFFDKFNLLIDVLREATPYNGKNLLMITIEFRHDEYFSSIEIVAKANSLFEIIENIGFGHRHSKIITLNSLNSDLISEYLSTKAKSLKLVSGKQVLTVYNF